MNKPVFGVCAVVEHEGRVLVVHRPGRPSDLCLPGGHVEPGEHPSEAAARELREETGLLAWRVELIYEADDSRGNVAQAYRAHVVRKGPLVAEPGYTAKWVKWSELLRYGYTFRAYNTELLRVLRAGRSAG
jgi:ADP-ribose pyrophosphatase YjhB (NUDIX family)